MKRITLKNLFILGAVASIAVLFQNCSDLQSQVQMASMSDSALALGAKDTSNIDGDPSITVDHPNDLPSDYIGDDRTETTSGTETTHTGSHENSDGESPAGGTSGSGGTTGGVTGGTTGTNLDEQEDNSDVLACQNLDLFHVVKKNVFEGVSNVIGGVGRNKIAGHVLVKSNEITSVQNLDSQTVITGLTARAKVGLVKNIEGRIILCNADVDTLEDTSGRLILVNSRIKHLVNKSGSFRLFGSTSEIVEQH